jgi:hypothetical protein
MTKDHALHSFAEACENDHGDVDQEKNNQKNRGKKVGQCEGNLARLSSENNSGCSSEPEAGFPSFLPDLLSFLLYDVTYHG